MKMFYRFRRLAAVALMLSLLMLQLSGCGIPAEAHSLTEGLSRTLPANRELNEKFSAGQLNFSVELLRRAAASKECKNTLVSPLSVAIALAMTANGADGQTAEEMLKVLGGHSMEELNGYLYSWMEQLPSDKTATLQMADSIWIREQPGFEAKLEFLQTNVDYYDAAIYKAPFDDTTVREINQWVDENTEGMIDQLLNQLESDTMMVLINALAFEAEWETPYEKHQVYKDLFSALDGEKNSVEYMRSEEATYLEDEGAIGFLRPYAGGRYSFGALLPEEGSFRDYLFALDGERLGNVLNGKRDATVFAELPKFTNEYEISLNDVLKEMGMTSAFSAADFSKMSNIELYIDEVIHKTFIEVDEKGTKASAVTGVMMDKESAIVYDEPPIYIKLDRPFVYFILDNQTNLPIFLGAVTQF